MLQFLMNAVYDFDTVRNNNIQMTLPSLEYYYQYKSELKDINVHLEFENLLHRSGFKNLDEIKEVLHHHENDNGSEMNIVGLWTHFDMQMNLMFQNMGLNVKHG